MGLHVLGNGPLMLGNGPHVLGNGAACVRPYDGIMSFEIMPHSGLCCLGLCCILDCVIRDYVCMLSECWCIKSRSSHLQYCTV